MERKKRMFVYRSDETREAIEDLRYFVFLLEQFINEEQALYWKRIITNLHTTVQNWMVCALTGSNGFLTYKKVERKNKDGSKERVTVQQLYDESTAHDDQPPMDRVRLLNTEDLYDQVKRFAGHYIQSKSFVAQQRHDAAMTWLINWRNDFAHFTPKMVLWYFDDAPKHCLHILEIVNFLIHESGNIAIDKAILTEVTALIQKASDLLKSIDPPTSSRLVLRGK